MIKFADLFYISMDISGKDEVSIIIDGGLPDTMMAKSAATIYRDYNVIWYTGKTFGLSRDEVI